MLVNSTGNLMRSYFHFHFSVCVCVCFSFSLQTHVKGCWEFWQIHLLISNFTAAAMPQPSNELMTEIKDDFENGTPSDWNLISSPSLSFPNAEQFVTWCAFQPVTTVEFALRNHPTKFRDLQFSTQLKPRALFRACIFCFIREVCFLHLPFCFSRQFL